MVADCAGGETRSGEIRLPAIRAIETVAIKTELVELHLFGSPAGCSHELEFSRVAPGFCDCSAHSIGTHGFKLRLTPTRLVESCDEFSSRRDLIWPASWLSRLKFAAIFREQAQIH